MIRVINEDYLYGTHKYMEFAGLSTDTKPEDDLATGSIFVEVNTGKVFFFNEAGTSGSRWVEQFSFQS